MGETEQKLRQEKWSEGKPSPVLVYYAHYLCGSRPLTTVAAR